MSLEEMEKRLTKLEDTESIKNMHREYLFHISNLEIDEALACFSENITVDIADFGVHKGIKEVTKFFKEIIYHNVSSSKDGHSTGQAVVTVDGNTAKGHWMFYRYVPRPSPKRWIQGRYDCEYVKEKGQWKFSFLKLTRPWPEFFK